MRVQFIVAGRGWAVLILLPLHTVVYSIRDSPLVRDSRVYSNKETDNEWALRIILEGVARSLIKSMQNQLVTERRAIPPFLGHCLHGNKTSLALIYSAKYEQLGQQSM